MNQRIIHPTFESKDERGILREIVSEGIWKTVNVSIRWAGSIIGNHYHKQMSELIYIISGRVQVRIYNVETGEKEEFEVGSNTGFIIKPYEHHTLKIIEDTTFIAFLSEKFDKSTPDLYRLE